MATTRESDSLGRQSAQNRLGDAELPAGRGTLRMSETPESRSDLSASERLFSLYDRMLGDVKIPNVLRDVAEVTCQDLNAERAAIYLINKETDELESVALIGNVSRTIHVPISAASLAGYCALSGRAFVAPDAYGDLSGIDAGLHFDQRWDEMNAFRTRDVMCAPATFKGDLVGVVQVVNSRGTPFSEVDLPPLKTISRLIGYALHHAKLYDDIATLKELERQKAEFIRMMVHELKSPVAASKMMADAVMASISEESPVKKMTSRISDRMAQLMDMIEELLYLAKVKAGGPLGEIAVLDLTSETLSGCREYHETAEQKGLALKLEVEDEPVHSRLDSQGFRLVLSNLVSNAIKYTLSGHVRICLKREDHWAVLEVEDTGMGIPEKDVPRLFTEFFRATNAKKSNIPGSGVGLAGAKSLVERFGGEFTLDTREGEGSVFTVKLPLHGPTPKIQ